MARRNPGISPILSARGYGARVLWPQYTPSGGINSGSEIPVPPRNTLQSNQSNMIYRENPFTPVTQNAPGRIQVTSKRGKTLYMTENQIRKMGSKMLADGEIERALGRSNPKRPVKRVPKGAGRSTGKGIGTGFRDFGKQSSQTSAIEQQYAQDLYTSGGKQLEQYLAAMSEDEQSKFATDYADLLENPKRPAKRPIKSVPKGAGRSSGKGIGTGLRSFGKKSFQAPTFEDEYAQELFESGGKQLEQYLANMSQDEQSKFTSDYADLLENPNVYRKGKGIHRTLTGPRRESEANRRERETYELFEIARPKAYPPTGRNNPFWVTPQGTAVHHSDKAWAGYQDKNVGVRLPAQAEREALLERQPTSLAPGFTVRVESMMTSSGRPAQAHKLFYRGRYTGKYALDGRKAIEISHAIDPETGKRRKA